MSLSKIHKRKLKNILFFNKTNIYCLESADKIKKNYLEIIFFFFLEDYSRRVLKSTNKKYSGLIVAHIVFTRFVLGGKSTNKNILALLFLRLFLEILCLVFAL